MSLQWTLDIDVARGGAGFRQASDYMKNLRSEALQTKNALKNISSKSSFGSFGNKSVGKASFEVPDFQHHTAAVGKFGQAGSKAGASMSAAFGLASVAIGATIMAVKKGAQELSEAGDKIIEYFSERNNSLRIYKTLLGDTERAEKEYRKAGVLAQKTELTQGQVQFAQQRLITQGFRGEKELDRALLSVMDVATATPTNRREMVMNSMLNAFKKMKGRDRTSLMEMKELGRGVQESLIFEELAKIKGVSVKDIIGDPSQKGKSKGMISKGMISGEEGIVATQRAIMRQFNTKKLGEFSVAGAGDLKALISNQEEAWENLAKSFDANTLPGIEKYKKSLQGLVNTIYDAEKGGGKLKEVVQDFGNTVGNVRGVFADFTASFLESFADSYVQQLKDMGYSTDEEQKKFEGISAAAMNFGSVLGGLGKWVAEAKVFLEDLAPTIDKVRTVFEYLGTAIKGVGDVLAGIKGMASDLVDELKEIASGKTLTEEELNKRTMKMFSFDNTKKIVGGAKDAVVGVAKANLAAGWGYGVDDSNRVKSQDKIKKHLVDNQEKILEFVANQDKKMQDIATAGVKAAQDSLASMGLGIKSQENKAAISIAGEAGVSGGGHGASKYVPGYHLGQFVPNMGAAGALSLRGASIQPFSGISSMGTSLYQANAKSINPNQSIVVQTLNINVETDGLSSEDVADAVYDKFVSQVNRLSRVPSVNRL